LTDGITPATATSIAPYDGIYPAYTTSHTYTFITDIPGSTPSKLYFGVGDSYYPDNTGSLDVHITQLEEAQVPDATSTLVLLLMPLGFFVVGTARGRVARLG
jgi:hypothetical protein